MSYSDPAEQPDHLWLTLGLLGLILGSFAYLAFGPGLDDAYAGYGALIALPMSVGALFTLQFGSYSPLGCLVAPVGLGLVCYALVLLGAEGFICVIMIMPIWFVAGLGGGLVALLVLRRDRNAGAAGSTTLRSVGIAVLPFLLIHADEVAPAEWQVRDVSRSIIVDADARDIWPLLVSIPNIAPDEGIATFTHDWLAVPRPQEARLVRRDNQLVRLARWGRDARFEEIVTHIEAGRSIGWTFSFPDPSLQNQVDRHVSPDGNVLKIRSGAYRLDPLADGRTRVTLTTRYAMRSRLGWYLGWWGEQMLGDVENNVLAIVRGRSER